MPPDELKANVHRFRVRDRSDLSAKTDRRRSASPDRLATTASPRNVQDVINGDDEVDSPLGKRRTVPSCDRCRTFKKKCSRTFPTCALCITAGQKCSLSTSVSSVEAQTYHLQARIKWLSDFVNSARILPPGQIIESFDTGTSIQAPALRLLADAASHSQELLSNVDSQALGPLPAEPGSSPGTALSGTSQSSTALENVHLPTTVNTRTLTTCVPGMTPTTLARQCVDAYFQHVNRAYPFVDMAKMYQEVLLIDDWESLKARKTPSATQFHLVMAIGCTTLQRVGKLPAESSSIFEIHYATIIGGALFDGGGPESLQTLVLVALYSLFDPRGVCAWSVAGMASRQAILTGFSRKVSDADALSSNEVESRHRVFWSTWVLDRMMSFSFGLPPALTDESHDIPLPGLTVEEFGSLERQYYTNMLQTNRHVIQLRHLEDQILRQVLLCKASEVATMSYADCRAKLQFIRADIENWYSNGCLVSPLEPDSVPTHSSISWLSARYYHLLLFLHYPCPLNSKGPGLAIEELLPLIQKCSQLTSVLLQQKQLPLNRVTLCRIFPVSLLLLHCASQADTTQISLLSESISMTSAVLEAFSAEWIEAHQAAVILRQYLDVITFQGATAQDRVHLNVLQHIGGLYGDVYSSSPCASTESHRSLLRSIIKRFAILMKTVLGSASCFIFEDFPAVRDHIQSHKPSQPITPFSTAYTMPAVSVAEGTVSDGPPPADDSIWRISDPAFF